MTKRVHPAQMARKVTGVTSAVALVGIVSGFQLSANATEQAAPQVAKDLSAPAASSAPVSSAAPTAAQASGAVSNPAPAAPAKTTTSSTSTTTSSGSVSAPAPAAAPAAAPAPAPAPATTSKQVTGTTKASG